MSPECKSRVRVGKYHKPRSGGRVPTAAGFLQESVCLAQRLYRNWYRRYAAQLNVDFTRGLLASQHAPSQPQQTQKRRLLGTPTKAARLGDPATRPGLTSTVPLRSSFVRFL